MSKWSRREVLRSSAAAGGAALVSSSILYSAFESSFLFGQAQPAMTFPTDPRERLAVATWPFRAEIESGTNEYRDRMKPGMDLRDFVVTIPEKFGVNGVEPLSAHFSSTSARYVHDLRDAIEKAHMRVVNVPVDNEFSFYDPEPANRNKAVGNSTKWVDIAVALGSPSVRTSMAEPKNGKPNVELAAASLKQVADYAAKKNIQVNLENDNLTSEDAFFVVKVIEKVNHPFLHALPDFCNSMASGNSSFNYEAVKAMFAHAYNICHVKDSEVGDGGKVYRISMKLTFDILKAANYRGYFSMEWEGPEDPYVGTKRLIDESLKQLGS
ncbi:MAG TPA: sugar phosphate isomerase/epimerase family protein [Dongiaceae bacterium]|nr:sugar phosphate isomerase/epimerase family protein [Dongiaceae bacterium]